MEQTQYYYRLDTGQLVHQGTDFKCETPVLSMKTSNNTLQGNAFKVLVEKLYFNETIIFSTSAGADNYSIFQYKFTPGPFPDRHNEYFVYTLTVTYTIKFDQEALANNQTEVPIDMVRIVKNPRTGKIHLLKESHLRNIHTCSYRRGTGKEYLRQPEHLDDELSSQDLSRRYESINSMMGATLLLRTIDEQADHQSISFGGFYKNSFPIYLRRVSEFNCI